MARSSMRNGVRRRVFLLVTGSAAAAVVVGGCTSDPEPESDAATYRSELISICADASIARAELAPPTDDVSVAGFAESISDIIATEADAARAVRPPSELSDDHRAFVQNTADQATRWRTLATTSPTDVEAFGLLQTEILQLSLGRDDLAATMGIEGCRTGQN